MNWWLWLLLGAALAIILPSTYSLFLLYKRIIKLRRGVIEQPKELGEFDGEVDINIPLDMIKEVTKEDLSKRIGLVTYHVVHSGKKWKIKRGGTEEVYAESKNKKILVKFAIEYCKREKAELKIHNKNRKIKISKSYGNYTKSND